MESLAWSINKNGANTAALNQYNDDSGKRIKIRQWKYLNNIVEQVHRLIKRIVRPMLGSKNFFSAQRTLMGIELMRMLKKGRLKSQAGMSKTPEGLFYALAK